MSRPKYGGMQHVFTRMTATQLKQMERTLRHKFDGKWYDFVRLYTLRSEAVKGARDERERGLSARVVPTSKRNAPYRYELWRRGQ